MITLDLKWIYDHINGIQFSGVLHQNIKTVCTDSRAIKPDSLFFALQGESFDGHNFVDQALDKGAVAAVVSKPGILFSERNKGTLIRVEDTLKALQLMAGAYRRMFNIPVIGVTGSVGKTTTKELTALCLGNLRTLKNEGNYNNDIGVPLSIMQLDRMHQIAVVEMGMSDRGEIRRLAEISRPTSAIITNVEAVHLENLGSVKNIALAKCEVLEEVPVDGFALLNGDCDELISVAQTYKCRQYLFGYGENCDFRILKTSIRKQGIEIEVDIGSQKEAFWLPIPAKKLAYNVIAAAAAAYLHGVSLDEIKAAIPLYKPIGNRLNIHYWPEGGALINDTYNANPISMAAALETIRELTCHGKIIAVLGDMFELGDNEKNGHIEVGEKLGRGGVDILVAVGDRAKYIMEGALLAGMKPEQMYHFPSKLDSYDFLLKTVSREDVILFKASRGMMLETLVEKIFGDILYI